MIFISLEPSTNPNKKYLIMLNDPKKTIHFGSKNSKKNLDHKDKKKRYNYLQRHYQKCQNFFSSFHNFLSLFFSLY